MRSLIMKYLLLVALVTTSFSGFTNANNGVYTSLKAGVSDTKMKDNSVHYDFDDGEYYSLENYTQNNQTKSIYPSISAAVGFDFSKTSNVDARLELEYSYRDKVKFTPTTNSEVWTTDQGSDSFLENIGSQLFSNELRTQSLMLNGYYDFTNSSKFIPYAGLGIGVTHIKNNYINLNYPDYAFSKKDNQFTWSAGLGVAYKVTDNVALDVSYRYVDAGKFEFDQNFGQNANEKTSFKLSSNDYALGIRYNF